MLCWAMPLLYVLFMAVQQISFSGDALAGLCFILFSLSFQSPCLSAVKGLTQFIESSAEARVLACMEVVAKGCYSKF